MTDEQKAQQEIVYINGEPVPVRLLRERGMVEGDTIRVFRVPATFRGIIGGRVSHEL